MAIAERPEPVTDNGSIASAIGASVASGTYSGPINGEIVNGPSQSGQSTGPKG